tara:strand:- start:7321 stop:7854 length:534 start_codon:yes stop_codon:yes gene_type:complete
MNKKVLILDMDETMIHSTVNGTNFRPHLITFLNNVYPYYDIYAFTLGTKPYAEPILDKICEIGKKDYFIERYYRHNAIVNDSYFLKNPVTIWKNYNINKIQKVRNTIIVDNNPNAFLFQKIYGITIKDFIDDPNDNCLLFLFPVLVKFAKSKETTLEFLPKTKKMLYSITKRDKSFY